MSSARLVLLCLTALFLIACGPSRAQPDRQHQPMSYVAIGASDTVGVGATNPERDAWPAQLYARLPTGSSLVNLGVAGSLLSDAIDQQLPVAVAAHPDLVTVWLAVNDMNARVTAEQYGGELDYLLRALRTTHAIILVGNVPDLVALPAYRGVPPELARAQVDAFNATITSVANRHGAVLVDLHASWTEAGQGGDLVSSDGFHPNTAGHARIAAEFWAALEARERPFGVSGG